MRETLKGQHQTESKCLENIKTHTNTNKKYINLFLYVPSSFCSQSVFFSHAEHVVRRKKHRKTTTKSLAPSGWRATSFCVSVTTSLISFNYFNCFYMNNSSIFPILYGLDCAVRCFAGCYCFVFCFC